MVPDLISAAITVSAESDTATLVGARHCRAPTRRHGKWPRRLALAMPPKKTLALPPSGLAVFMGRAGDAALFHSFLPRLLAEGKQVLMSRRGEPFDPLFDCAAGAAAGEASGGVHRRNPP